MGAEEETPCRGVSLRDRQIGGVPFIDTEVRPTETELAATHHNLLRRMPVAEPPQIATEFRGWNFCQLLSVVFAETSTTVRAST